MIANLTRSLSTLGFAILIIVSAPALAADAPTSEELFLACAACHSTAPDALGPNLENVIGRDAASRDDFRYSPAMQRSGIVWSEENLREFLLNPQGFIQGNRMPFSGFSDPTEADAVIRYLRELQ